MKTQTIRSTYYFYDGKIRSSSNNGTTFKTI